MVNSLERLFAGVVATLEAAGRSVTDAYVRSQVFAAIDVLNNLAHRVEWKRSDLMAQIEDMAAVCRALGELLGGYAAASEAADRLLACASPPDAGCADLPAWRDRLARVLVDATQALASARDLLPPAVVGESERRLDAWLRRQLDRELALLRAPLFRRISEA